jgi:alpha-glucosidase (family GH31 glycosyl hydrolase)
MYLAYPGEQEAYATSGSQYLYGPDLLVAPVTTPGDTATTPVWFPPGTWTDYFTGKTYTGGRTVNISTGLDSMPVFIKAGGIMPTRSHNVTDDVHHPLTDVTLSVATGANGSYNLYEDSGAGPEKNRSATTTVRYRESGMHHTVTIDPVKGSFPGQVTKRSWTLSLLGTHAPTRVTASGVRLSPHAYHWDGSTGILTVTLPPHTVHSPVSVSYQ